MIHQHTATLASTLFSALSCVAMMLTTGPAHANSITLDVDASSRYSKGSVRLKMVTINKGTEAADDIRVEVFLGDVHVESDTLARLDINEDHEWFLELGAPPQPPGIHTIVIRIHYTDTFGHPVSGLHTTQVFTGDVSPGEAFEADLEWTEMKESGSVTLSLSSQGDVAQEIACRLVLPVELQCAEPSISLSLAPRGQASHAFSLRNTTALRGSRYRIYAIMDFVKDGRHHSIQKPALLTIQPHKSMTRRAQSSWIAIALLLLIAFFIAQSRTREG
jgi:hypothetical protein